MTKRLNEREAMAMLLVSCSFMLYSTSAPSSPAAASSSSSLSPHRSLHVVSTLAREMSNLAWRLVCRVPSSMPLRGGRSEETPGKQTRKASKRRAPADADQEARDQEEKGRCSRDASAEQPHEIHSKTKKKRGKEDHASTSNSSSTIVDGDEVLKRLQSLEKKKKEAISLEDFDSASKIKAEIKDLEAKLKTIGKSDILSGESKSR